MYAQNGFFKNVFSVKIISLFSVQNAIDKEQLRCRTVIDRLNPHEEMPICGIYDRLQQSPWSKNLFSSVWQLSGFCAIRSHLFLFNRNSRSVSLLEADSRQHIARILKLVWENGLSFNELLQMNDLTEFILLRPSKTGRISTRKCEKICH